MVWRAKILDEHVPSGRNTTSQGTLVKIKILLFLGRRRVVVARVLVYVLLFGPGCFFV